MSKNRTQKGELLTQYLDMIKSNSGYLLVDTSGLDTLTITNFKMKLNEVGANYAVIKNSVFKIALQETNQPVETQTFDGPTAVISYSEDPTAAAKLVKELQKTSEKFNAKLGTINGSYINADRVMQLADIPSREELLAKLLGSMNAPLTGVMNAITGNIRGFTMVLKQLSEKEAK
ncbi:MAG: 50S ribosomal protein L10 [candidate division WS6 bacterium GW2011_GWF2_39_15]|uniref:Large ribosomal subunit protein uL10 n=1 Tax=candidate division WS6 bacterium GW2011_GWF2_39_15 TaxID=1619100 RepID=A0A0G0MT87_9BACT|nr:MAG: 50S ribosomal protein L10 [candidate division WS6 bacterium GW2011_GWF2_39_15]